MDSQRSFASIDETIDFAIGREQDARRAYLAFAQTTRRKGFRQLLLTMADMEAEHEKKLLELRRRGAAPGLFRAPRGSDLQLSGQMAEAQFSPDMEYGDFLVLVMKKEAEAEGLYTRLMGLADSAEVRALFGLLAQEEASHRAWAQERYDEDILREN
jgi:rubrerythrin